MLPTFAFVDQTRVLLQSGLSPAGLTYDIWQQLGAAWTSLATDVGVDATHMQELGELLGLAVGPDGSRLTAVPVTTAGVSALLVRAVTPVPSTTPSPVASPPLASPPTGSSSVPDVVAAPQQRGVGAVTVVLAGSGVVLLLVARSAARRRRRRMRIDHDDRIDPGSGSF